MRGLTLCQPWASLVALGAKRIETRSWATSYRGVVAIHAAQGLGPVGGQQGLMELCRSEPFRSVLLAAGILGTPALPYGAIVAVATVEGCRPISTDEKYGFKLYREPGDAWTQVSEPEASFGDYTPGRYGWLLSDVRRLPEPIPYRGALGLWIVPTELKRRIEENTK